MLETEIQGLREDIRALTAALQILRAPTDKPALVVQPEAPKPEPVPPTPTPTGPSAPTPVESGVAAPVTPATAPAPASLDDVKERIRTLVIEVSTKHGPQAFLSVLGRYGAKALRDIPVDSYDELIAHLGRVSAEGESAI